MNRALGHVPPARSGTRATIQPGVFFQSLVEQLEDAVLVVLPGAGLCQYANLPAAELTGYSRDELTHLSLAELIAVGEAPDALEQIYGALGGPVRTLLNVPLRTRSGTQVLTDLRVGAVGGSAPFRRDSDKPALLVLARPAALRLAREQEDAQRNHALAALQRLAAFLPAPEAVELAEVLEQCTAALEADTAAIYGVTTDPPGITLSRAVNLPLDFPKQLGAGDAQACLQPLNWLPGQRPELGAFSRGALCWVGGAGGAPAERRALVVRVDPGGIQAGPHAAAKRKRHAGCGCQPGLVAANPPVPQSDAPPGREPRRRAGPAVGGHSRGDGRLRDHARCRRAGRGD